MRRVLYVLMVLSWALIGGGFLLNLMTGDTGSYYGTPALVVPAIFTVAYYAVARHSGRPA